MIRNALIIIVVFSIAAFVGILTVVSNRNSKTQPAEFRLYEAFIRQNYSYCMKLLESFDESQYNAKMHYIKAFCVVKNKKLLDFDSVLLDLEKALVLETNTNQYIKNLISEVVIQKLENKFAFSPMHEISDLLIGDEVILLDKATRNPKNHKAFYYRGLFRFERNDTDSIADFSVAIEQMPNCRTYHLARAMANQSFGKFQEAIEDFNTYQNHASNDCEGLYFSIQLEKHRVYFRMGQCYFGMNEKDLAIKMFDEAKLLCPFQEIEDFSKSITKLIDENR